MKVEKEEWEKQEKDRERKITRTRKIREWKSKRM